MECEIPLHQPADGDIARILSSTRTIAVVGISDNPERDSHRVADYLRRNGYRVIPVNPRLRDWQGERAYASLRDIAEPIDLVDVFRRSDAVPALVEEAIAAGARTVWMQEGVVHNAAAERARAAGLQVVMNRCILKEHLRHGGAGGGSHRRGGGG
jgi:hypothetical protein